MLRAWEGARRRNVERLSERRVDDVCDGEVKRLRGFCPENSAAWSYCTYSEVFFVVLQCEREILVSVGIFLPTNHLRADRN